MTRRIFAGDNIEASIVSVNDKSIMPLQNEINILLPPTAESHPLIFLRPPPYRRLHDMLRIDMRAASTPITYAHRIYTNICARNFRAHLMPRICSTCEAFIYYSGKCASFSRAVYLPSSRKITTDQAPAGYTSLRDKYRALLNRNVFRTVSLTRLMPREFLLQWWI